ncbi:hypothetical protein SAVIM40S_08262 [Streptomyces avidinii]
MNSATVAAVAAATAAKSPSARSVWPSRIRNPVPAMSAKVFVRPSGPASEFWMTTPTTTRLDSCAIRCSSMVITSSKPKPCPVWLSRFSAMVPSGDRLPKCTDWTGVPWRSAAP